MTRNEETAPRIVFDFGGVVFHWRPDDLVSRCFPRQVTDAASARAMVDAVFQGFGGDWALFDRGRVEADELVRRIAARTGLPAPQVQSLVEAVPHSLTPRHDTVELVARLGESGAWLHFLSNMPRPYAEHLDREHPQLMAHFRSGLYSSRVHLVKPETQMFALAAEHFDAAAEQLVLLDDSPTNVAAARAQGWKALLFSDAAVCERELREQGWWPSV